MVLELIKQRRKRVSYALFVVSPLCMLALMTMLRVPRVEAARVSMMCKAVPSPSRKHWGWRLCSLLCTSAVQVLHVATVEALESSHSSTLLPSEGVLVPFSAHNFSFVLLVCTLFD
ncbi:hypothetical protein TRVL_07934 [Trypanosoma vivax]|nr:hypothetical protein TRVL_07934 [Trypanosoma vivax]